MRLVLALMAVPSVAAGCLATVAHWAVDGARQLCDWMGQTPSPCGSVQGVLREDILFGLLWAGASYVVLVIAVLVASRVAGYRR